MFVELAVLTVLAAIYSVYLISKRKFHYWEKKKVPHLPPTPILGNFADYILQKKYFGQTTQKLCQNFPNEPYIGAYYGTEPVLIVQDPEFVKLVMTKDFYFFSGREVSNYSHKELVTQNLFFSYGDQWKVLRQNLTPIFSSSKMKNMFPLIENCCRVFESMLDREIKTSGELEVRVILSRYTMDCIGTCAFGVETKTMDKTENNPFKAIGDTIFNTRSFHAFKNVARSIWPSIFYALGFKTLPSNVGVFFTNLMTSVFEGREYKPTSRNDFVDQVLKLKVNKLMIGDSLTNMKSDSGSKVSLEVDDNLLVAQCFLFFAAGYETSSTTLTYTLFELAKSPEAQQKAIDEVDNYLRTHDNKLDYECVAGSPYLEACVEEALRMYPVLGVITREVIEEYTFPTGLKLEKGLRVHLPVYHLHYNPDFFPEPNQYRPERFLGEEKKNIKPYTYIPFGEGPRICIGMRFAKMQMMAGLITILKKYRLELAPGMKSDLEFEPKSIVIQPTEGIRLKFIEREGWEERVLKK